MDRLRIRGGAPLHGEIKISGAKNAALPLMAAGLLSSEGLTLENLPDLADIASMAELLQGLGATVDRTAGAAAVLTHHALTQVLQQRAALYGRGGALADVTQSQRVHASKAAREYTFVLHCGLSRRVLHGLRCLVSVGRSPLGWEVVAHRHAGAVCNGLPRVECGAHVEVVRHGPIS